MMRKCNIFIKIIIHVVLLSRGKVRGIQKNLNLTKKSKKIDKDMISQISVRSCSTVQLVITFSILLMLSITSCLTFAEVQVVDYSVGSKSIPAREPNPIFVPISNSSKGLSIEQRIIKLENQMENSNKQNNKIDELQNEIQKLTGQNEEKTHQIEQLNSQIRNICEDRNQSLEKNNQENVSTQKIKSEKSAVDKSKAITDPIISDQTIGDVVKAVPNNVSETAVASVVQNQDTPQKPKTDRDFLKEQQMYQSAIDLLPGKNYATSSRKLRTYIEIYPKGTYVANAHYWLGEINFLNKNYKAAEKEFQIVINEHPKSKKVSEAMFKLSLVHQSQGIQVQAKKELENVVKKYPGTSAASLAKIQLEGN